MNDTKKYCVAVVLAAGSGKRMNSATAKQFITILDKPIVYYSLHTVQQSAVIDECILVTGETDIPYVQKEIVEKYGFSKVRCVIAGGRERWESVAKAVKYIAEEKICENGFVFIHDGARPFLSEEILQDGYDTVEQFGACVAAVPSKDTVKIADENGFAAETPDRKSVYAVQTPQIFETALVARAYGLLQAEAEAHGFETITVTDDAGVVERYTDVPVKFSKGSYKNIKITTPEDLLIAEAFLGATK